MLLYDMHCNNGECDYTGEHLLKNRNEALQCPECETGVLERNIIQPFNIGKSSKHEASQCSEGKEMEGINHLLNFIPPPEGSEVQKSVENGYGAAKVMLPCGHCGVKIVDVTTPRERPDLN